jgi:hypothetical protein
VVVPTEGVPLMDDNQIKELIMSRQHSGSISCKEAFEIAEEAGASSRKIGRLLDEMKIKIRACQLGCFQ